jgi:hypothetical protein
MRTVIIFIAFFSILACNQSSKTNNIVALPKNSKTVQITLVDSLGKVELSIPSGYDTSFSWTHTSDCGKSWDEIKYRLQPKTLPIFKESGFMWEERKDSINQLTIYHSGEYPFNDGADSNIIFRHHKVVIEGILYDSLHKKIKIDTVEKIVDRYYSIIAYEELDKRKAPFSKAVMAFTTVKDNLIHFDYQEDSLYSNFILNSILLLRTIHLSNGR